ncbi:hypothetical protein HaLaN_03341 [Haematococcus lacustris]|uniref:Uncharacterized protein n=1 Tax=Haematococcus lacustris TaxID=44745 RepID=A0A699YE15_HAELA|nr:hypothetical protein HaLaN_03341 [Haematococcus lacustris]
MEITGPACSSLCLFQFLWPREHAAEYARPDDSDSTTARSRKRHRTTGPRPHLPPNRHRVPRITGAVASELRHRGSRLCVVDRLAFAGLTLKAQPAAATDTCGIGRPCPASSSRSSTTMASALIPQQQGVVSGVPLTAWAPLRLVPGPRPPLHLTAPGLAYLDKGSLQLRVLKAVQERGAAAAARRRGLQHGKAVAHGPAASEAVGRLAA